VRELFDSIDTNGSGFVDSEELRQVREGGGRGRGGGEGGEGGEGEGGQRVLVERSVDTKELRQV
jgi:Ca2+-binding EF-hand superfamily protein